MLPPWNSQGVLPPIRPGSKGNDSDRSPYSVTLPYLVERFASSSERVHILEGLLNYRQALHAVGIVSGFQWLDGSFVEEIEQVETRAPRDVDVITFFYLPDGMDQAQLARDHSHLFQTQQTKSQFLVDGYPFVLGGPTANHVINRIAYWYSMWSHRRSGLWKGFVQVNLAPDEDARARAALVQVQQEGALP